MSFFGDTILHSFDPVWRQTLVHTARQALALEPKVQVAFLFGSLGRGDPFRDIDIGVMLDEPFTAMDVARLSTRLWLSMGKPAPELDIVPLNDAPPGFRLNAADGIVLLERWRGAASECWLDARRELLDFEESLGAIERETARGTEAQR